jgi:hypothetical protein
MGLLDIDTPELIKTMKELVHQKKTLTVQEMLDELDRKRQNRIRKAESYYRVKEEQEE